VAGEDLGAPRGEGLGEGADGGHAVVGAAADRLVEQGRGVDVTDRFLGQPGAEQFVVRVADAQAQEHPVGAALVEEFTVVSSSPRIR
jgi:hypothetical protein